MQLTITQVEAWQEVAFDLYFKTHGRRCVKCSKLVAAQDAALHRMEPGGELLLTHKTCEP